MNVWNQYPLLRVILPLILGVIVQWYLPNFHIPFFIPIIALVLLIVWFVIPSSKTKFRFRYWSAFLIMALFLFTGFFLTNSKQENIHKNHYSQNDSIAFIFLRIEQPLEPTKKSYKTIGKVLGVERISDSIMRPAMGKLMLYFEKSDSIHLQYGDEIIVNSHFLNPIKNMGNPHEFDYQSYLARKQIYHQLYLRSTDWVATNNNTGNTIFKWSFELRDRLIAILNSYNYSEENFAVASAILLGYDEFLDQDLRQLYAGSGAMHILCVSGLHVGILFLLLNIFLKPMDRNKHLKWLKIILIALIIWFYALITGMSPSVFRSATMFTFISIGQILNRRTSVYNSLAASAVVLILFDPFVIFHIGFQLSYSAILGILLIQSKISALVKSRNKIIRYFWDLVAVSIGAQIGTFAISVFYFHQFPNYFIITNLLVIPLSFVILTSGFIILVLDLTGLVSLSFLSWTPKILSFFLDFMNTGIDYINKLPYSVSSDLFFTFNDLVFIYLIIALFILFLEYRKIKYIYFVISLFSVLMIINGVQRISKFNEKTASLIIYHIPNNGILEYKQGKKSIIMLDSALFEEGQFNRYLLESKLRQRTKHQEFKFMDSLTSQLVLLDFTKWNAILIDKNTEIPKEKQKVDFIWMRNNPSTNKKKLLNQIETDALVFDASNDYWFVNKWQKWADSVNIETHYIKEKGAFILKTPLP